MHQRLPLNHPGRQAISPSHDGGEPNDMPDFPGWPASRNMPQFSYERMRHIYLKLRANKTGSGITSQPGELTDRRHRPSSFTPRGESITAAHAVRLLADPLWSMQEHRGGPVLLCKTKGGIEAVSGSGTLLAALPVSLRRLATHLPCDWVMEGSIRESGFLAHDLHALAGIDFRSFAYRWRHSVIEELFHPARPALQVLETAWETMSKTELLQRLHDGGSSGVVFRKSNRGTTAASDVLEYVFRTGRAATSTAANRQPGMRPPLVANPFMKGNN